MISVAGTTRPSGPQNHPDKSSTDEQAKAKRYRQQLQPLYAQLPKIDAEIAKMKSFRGRRLQGLFLRLGPIQRRKAPESRRSHQPAAETKNRSCRPHRRHRRSGAPRWRVARRFALGLFSPRRKPVRARPATYLAAAPVPRASASRSGNRARPANASSVSRSAASNSTSILPSIRFTCTRRAVTVSAATMPQRELFGSLARKACQRVQR